MQIYLLTVVSTDCNQCCGCGACPGCISSESTQVDHPTGVDTSPVTLTRVYDPSQCNNTRMSTENTRSASVHPPNVPCLSNRDELSPLELTEPPGDEVPCRIRSDWTQNEFCPIDIADMLRLNMEPFAPGQNGLSNQNRLVRNEVIVAKVVAELQTEYSKLRESAITGDLAFWRIFIDYKKKLDELAGHIQSSTDYQRRLQKSLSLLIAHVNNANSAHQSQVLGVKAAVRRLQENAHTGRYQCPGNMQGACSMVSVKFWFLIRYNSKLIELDQPQDRNYVESGGNTIGAAIESTKADVAVGPVRYDPETMGKIVEEYMQGVGLTWYMIKSLDFCPGQPDFIKIRFLTPFYARQFISLVSYRGLRTRAFPPLAFLVDEWDQNLEWIADARSASGVSIDINMSSQSWSIFANGGTQSR